MLLLLYLLPERCYLGDIVGMIVGVLFVGL